jgi:hypothetical protein
MIRVTEADQVRDDHEQPVRETAIRIVAPEYGQPRHDREERQRNGVDLLVHDALVPHSEHGALNTAAVTAARMRVHRSGDHAANTALQRETRFPLRLHYRGRQQVHTHRYRPEWNQATPLGRAARTAVARRMRNASVYAAVMYSLASHIAVVGASVAT